MFLSRPRATKWENFSRRDVKVFPRDSDSECSACPSGLLIHIVHPCTPSHLASRCQLAPPAPSSLARELTTRRRCAPRRSLRVPPPPPVACVPGAPSPTLSALPPPPPPSPHSASRCRQPVSPASSAPRYARCRRRRSCFPNPPQTTRVPPPSPLVVRAPGIPALGTTHTATAAAPAALSIRRPSRHRPPPPTTLPGTCTTH
jgi:hypothetical protein